MSATNVVQKDNVATILDRAMDAGEVVALPKSEAAADEPGNPTPEQ